MFADMKQFVPSSVCLSCKGCCRYKEENSCWRARLGTQESTAFLNGTVDTQGFIKTVLRSSSHTCYFLDSDMNICKNYADRHFQCTIYPFVLTKNKNNVTLSVHWGCPYIQEQLGSEEFKEYACYLKEYFAQENVKAFLKENPSLVQDYSQYSDELDDLFMI